MGPCEDEPVDRRPTPPRPSAALRREAIRAVRRGEAVRQPAAAPLAIVAARRVQQQRTWPWSVIIPAVVLAGLGIAIGGFALIWYVLTVVPAIASEPWRARRRRDKALSAELANIALLENPHGNRGPNPD